MKFIIDYVNTFKSSKNGKDYTTVQVRFADAEQGVNSYGNRHLPTAVFLEGVRTFKIGEIVDCPTTIDNDGKLRVTDIPTSKGMFQ